MNGKVLAAIRWLSENSGGGVLRPFERVTQDSTEMVFDALRKKHPDPVTPPSSMLIECDDLPCLEEVEVTSGHILHVAKSIQGSAGPGCSDSLHWQDCLLRYGAHSEKLRNSVAFLCRRLANSIAPWSDVQALMASRLIALDKYPGIQPIGIGECLRRILGKAICMVTRMDIEGAAGIKQLCAGVRAGIEGAVHAILELFEDNLNWVGVC